MRDQQTEREAVIAMLKETQATPELTIGQAIGLVLRRRRKLLGMSQDTVGKRCGIERPIVSRIERGTHEPSITTVRRIAQAMACEASDVLQTAEYVERYGPAFAHHVQIPTTRPERA